LARPGLFTHPALLAANVGLVEHFGYADQVNALQWVQRNIEAFGGNARRVTIIGESLGGASIIRHLTSSSSFGLFHQAMIMSGGSHWGPITRPLEDVLREGRVADVRVIIGADMSRDEPARMVARKVTAQGQRAWLYRFTGDTTRTQSRSADAVELPFVFRTLDSTIESVTLNDERIALAFNAYVSRFVKHGDPNGDGLPGWPPFESSALNLMHFAHEGPGYERDPRDVELVERAAGAWVANARH
jgi:carboxylesterase type B